MRKLYYILFLVMFLCIGCEWHLKSIDKDGATSFKVERYDIVESTYLTTGSFSALQEMKTSFPEETCMLIEDVLKIGAIDEPDINAKLYVYYKDSTLRNIISDVRKQFSNISDVEKDLDKSFIELKKHFPTIDIPRVYTQIGALNQSIIVSNGAICICLDKYLGASYPLYSKYYSDEQRSTMERRMIVPDCMLFYLLSCFPMPENQACTDSLSEQQRMHVGKIKWVVNKLTGKKAFSDTFVAKVDAYMVKNKKATINNLLTGE